MKDIFTQFIDELAKESGQYALCEAVKQGYKVRCEAMDNGIKPSADISVDDVQQMLDDGVDLSKYFINPYIIKINDKFNIVRDDKLLSNQWFDAVSYDFPDGFAEVELNGKCNLIDTDGNLLSDTWFDFISGDGFEDGCIRVSLKGKWNYLSKDGRLLSYRWLDECSRFVNGFGRVKVVTQQHETISETSSDSVMLTKSVDKWNLIDTDGNFLSNQWFEDISYMDDTSGLATVELNGKYNFIDTDGNLLSNQWFDRVEDFYMKDTSRVKLDGKWYTIDTNGNLSPDKNV